LGSIASFEQTRSISDCCQSFTTHPVDTFPTTTSHKASHSLAVPFQKQISPFDEISNFIIQSIKKIPKVSWMKQRETRGGPPQQRLKNGSITPTKHRNPTAKLTKNNKHAPETKKRNRPSPSSTSYLKN
jgi:hypothetical protein